MAVNRFVLNTISYHGKGAIKEIPGEITRRGYKKAFVCSDPDLVKFGVTAKVTDELDAAGIPWTLYSEIKPNPTIQNVKDGVEAYKTSGADMMVAIGGGSSLDTCKGIGDPDMMASMPAGLTAATGMDALTHAIEGYTTKGAWELSDMFHYKAIELISKNLRDSVAEAKSGEPGSGREGMALGQYIAGMGFSNVGLGIDHSMAHTLSAHYDTPHGVACAMLLPIAMEFNKPVVTERLAEVAKAMGVDTTGMTTDEAADAAIAAVKQLSADVNIPTVCQAMKADEIDQLATDAMNDACFPGNPREATHEDVVELFKKICPEA